MKKTLALLMCLLVTSASAQTLVAIRQGGTGQRTAANALNALLPSQTGNNGKYLTTDGTIASWATVTGGSGMTNPLVATGDMIYSSSGTTPAPLSIGTAGQVLTVVSGVPAWATAGGGGLTNWTESVNTSAPNATVPAVRFLATNAATNVDAVLSPKGTGAVLARVSDNTAAGGNKRGTYAVDWQTSRGVNTQVASGNTSVVSGGGSNTASLSYATVSGGYSNTASGTFSAVSGGQSNTASQQYTTVSGGYNNTASGNTSVVSGGQSNTASQQYTAVSGGINNTASGDYSSISGGYNALANKYGQNAFASGYFSAQGDAQGSRMVSRKATTDATANVELFLDGSSARMTMADNTAWTFEVNIIGKKTSSVLAAGWQISGVIVRGSGAGTTALVAAITKTALGNTIGGTSDATVTADATNGSLKISVTGVAATNIRWVAVTRLSEVTY